MKTWRNSLLYLCAAIVAVGFCRCSDEITSESRTQFQFPRVVHGPLNPGNPCDSFGIKHNLRCEFSNSYIINPDTTIAQKLLWIGASIFDLADSLGWSQEYAAAILDSAEAYANSLDSTFDPVVELMALTSSAYITEREANYINQIGIAFSQATDSAALMSSILQIENTMIEEDWNEGETEALSILSGCKHGWCFWYALTGGSFGMEISIYIAVTDLCAHAHQIENGASGNDAGAIMHIMSNLAATGWRPGDLMAILD